MWIFDLMRSIGRGGTWSWNFWLLIGHMILGIAFASKRWGMARLRVMTD